MTNNLNITWWDTTSKLHTNQHQLGCCKDSGWWNKTLNSVCPSDTTLESAEALSRAGVSPKGCTRLADLQRHRNGLGMRSWRITLCQLTLEQIQAHSPTYVQVAKNLCAHFDVLNLCVRNDPCPVQSPSRQSMLADVEVLSVYVASLDLDKQSSDVAQCSRVTVLADP